MATAETIIRGPVRRSDVALREKVAEYEEQERAALALVRRCLSEARSQRATGKLAVEFDLREGGIVAKWINTHFSAR